MIRLLPIAFVECAAAISEGLVARPHFEAGFDEGNQGLVFAEGQRSLKNQYREIEDFLILMIFLDLQ